MSITKNKWHDEFCDSFPEATKFHTILRNRCLEVDSVNLSSWVRFNCCPSKKCLYIVGYSIAEIFIATLYDYISSSNSIIHSLEFKIPKFGVECIKFKLDMDKITPDFDWEQSLPPATLLEKTLRTCYLRYYQNINKHPFVSRGKANLYLPMILVCKRKQVPEEIEDMIYQFVNGKPINRYNNILKELNYTLENTTHDISLENLHRLWKSINTLIY